MDDARNLHEARPMKLSVMMITYNHQRYLRQALDSVLMQKVDFDYEIVVGEDHSTDGTREILLEYQRAHPDKFRLLLHHQNIGVIRNCFSTLAECKGEYVALLEGDDYWTCDTKLKKQVEFLDAHPGYAICFHNATGHFEADDRPEFNYVHADQPDTIELADLLQDNVIPTCSAVFRRGVAEPYPSWVYELKMADYPLHVLNAQFGKIGYLNEVMAVYRIHPGGVWTGMDSLSRQQETIRFFEFLARTLDRKHVPTVKLELARKYWRLASELEGRAELRQARFNALRSLRTKLFTTRPKFRHKARALVRMTAPGIYGRAGQIYRSFSGHSSSQRTTYTATAHTPRISIIIPAYNAQRYVVQAVQSMLTQTFREFECILIDDGSTDRTPQYLQEMAERDKRVRYLRVPHGGIVEALNAGLYAARGQLIARMDSDDVAMPPRLEEQVKFLEQNPEVIAVGSKVLLVDPYNSPLWEIDVRAEHAGIENELLRGNGWALFHPTALIRHSAIDKVGLYRPEYQWSEDIDLFLRLAEVGRLANLSKPLLRYRQHFSSVNRTKLELQSRRVERLLAEAYRRRGISLPTDFRFEPNAPLPPFEQVRAWGRRAIINGNFRAARRHALAAMRFAPLNYDSWSLMYHAVAGRE